MDRNGLSPRNMTGMPLSLSARRAWIEIAGAGIVGNTDVVALRKESVDRNTFIGGTQKWMLSRSPQGERG